MTQTQGHLFGQLDIFDVLAETPAAAPADTFTPAGMAELEAAINGQAAAACTCEMCPSRCTTHGLDATMLPEAAAPVSGSYCCRSCCMICGREMYVDLNQPGRPWVHSDGWTREEKPCQRIKRGDYVRQMGPDASYHAEAPVRVESIRGPWATLSYGGGLYRWTEHVMMLVLVP